MNEKGNIEIHAITVEILFSNDTVKCHSLIAVEAMKKMLKNEKCESEITLAWAVSVKKQFRITQDIVQMNLYFVSI